MRTLLVDISNSFTKFAAAEGMRIGRVRRHPTREVSVKLAQEWQRELRCERVVVSSVVPTKNRCFPKALFLTASLRLGIRIDYPEPSRIGADRLANAVACASIYGCPAIVVDFGTAVTFDVISADCAYTGGVIAPGLNALTDYLHEKTALLPKVQLREPRRIVGKSTDQAMLTGAVIGYRGLINEIVARISEEAFPEIAPKIIATGGDARLVGKKMPSWHAIDPILTLKGLARVAELNPPEN